MEKTLENSISKEGQLSNFQRMPSCCELTWKKGKQGDWSLEESINSGTCWFHPYDELSTIC